jgi:deazaflavin-dependent oxidoreductase (nitroreductase family)
VSTRPGGLRRFVGRFGATRPITWASARVLHRIDLLTCHLSGGRVTFSSLVSGLPVAMLTTTGARTGAARTVPVLAVPDGEEFVVIASNFGRRRNPGWYHNLRAHPRACLVVRDSTHCVEARELDGDERERCFQRGVEINPGWIQYRRRAPDRPIPVIQLIRRKT